MILEYLVLLAYVQHFPRLISKKQECKHLLFFQRLPSCTLICERPRTWSIWCTTRVLTGAITLGTEDLLVQVYGSNRENEEGVNCTSWNFSDKIQIPQNRLKTHRQHRYQQNHTKLDKTQYKTDL